MIKVTDELKNFFLPYCHVSEGTSASSLSNLLASLIYFNYVMKYMHMLIHTQREIIHTHTYLKNLDYSLETDTLILRAIIAVYSIYLNE